MMKERVPLSKHVHYRIGGRARYFVAPRTVAELKRALKDAHKKKQNIFILGSGTNVLVSEKGFDGVVIRPELKTLRVRGTKIEAGAGVLMSKLLEFAAKNGLSGLEWAGGLPGTVGGAVRGNAGAFGGETKDSVFSVTSVDAKTLRERNRSAKECRFAYRASVFKEENGKEVITSVVFSLKKGSSKTIRAAMKEKIAYRMARHPMDYPNIGSIFKNVPISQLSPAAKKKFSHLVKNDPSPVVPAVHFIIGSGLRGVSFGGAQISQQHPNFIVNVLGATSDDVEQLIALVKRTVKKKFGVILEEEVMKL